MTDNLASVLSPEKELEVEAEFYEKVFMKQGLNTLAPFKLVNRVHDRIYRKFHSRFLL